MNMKTSVVTTFLKREEIPPTIISFSIFLTMIFALVVSTKSSRKNYVDVISRSDKFAVQNKPNGLHENIVERSLGYQKFLPTLMTR